MGLIRAGIGALGGTLADQWKEFFYCDSLEKDVLMVKGEKRTTSRSSNTKGNDNIISNGSGIAVADGQCMLIVEQGKVVEVCAEPGEFTWDSSTEPSIFAGKLGESILETFKTIGKRFTYGGDTGKDQRVYYINTKEIMDNKFGTPTPIPFRVLDRNIGLDMDTEIKCNGVYSYRIADPIIFYTKIAANVADEYRRSELDSQLKTEFVDALSPAFAQLSELGLRPAQVPAHTKELRDNANVALKELWYENRGIEIVSIAMNPVSISEEDAEYLKKYQRGAAAGRNPGMAGGYLNESIGEAYRDAAKNQGGGMNGGFVGLGIGMNTMSGGAAAANDLIAMGQAQQQVQQPQQPAAPTQGGWNCPKCGAVNQGNFCTNCGQAKPEAPSGWFCGNCGTKNEGNFCTNCGQPRP